MERNFRLSVAGFVFKIGQKLRNPSINKWYNFLKESEKWSVEELEKYQFLKLKELIEISYNSSVYYKNKFDEAGLKPSDIQGLSDIKKIPISTKNDLITCTKEIHSNLRFKKLLKANTSGTSGTSLKFLREESADSFNRASIFRGYSWYNVKPWEYNGYLWGFNFSFIQKIKTRVLDGLQNRFRLFEYQENKVAKFLKKLEKATYLHGYSSMIYELAKKVNEKQQGKPLQLKMVKGTSEKIFESYQNEIRKAFNQKIINEYGAAETGIIAFECKNGTMHVNMEGVIVEEIENEIVVTNLQMHSFPIIRYKLGDYIKLKPKNELCDCGMKHLIIDEVTGRIGKNVLGKQNTYPSLYFYYIFKNLAVKNKLYLTYQVIQNNKGHLKFNIEQNLLSDEIELLKKEIVKYFKDDIDFDVNHSKKIIFNKKKQQSFISNIEA